MIHRRQENSISKELYLEGIMIENETYEEFAQRIKKMIHRADNESVIISLNIAKEEFIKKYNLVDLSDVMGSFGVKFSKL